MADPVVPNTRRVNSGPAWLAAVLAALVCLPVAADQVVDFDHEFDFSTIKTYAFRNTTIGIDRPETHNDIVMSDTTGAIRAALNAHGLRETREGADVLIDWQVTGQGMIIGPGGQARPTGYGQGQRWSNGNRDGQPPTFIESLLVVDMTVRSSGLLVFRGVHRNRDRDAAAIAQALPAYARKLVEDYPRRRK
jgi:hypothetical protein